MWWEEIYTFRCFRILEIEIHRLLQNVRMPRIWLKTDYFSIDITLNLEARQHVSLLNICKRKIENPLPDFNLSSGRNNLLPLDILPLYKTSQNGSNTPRRNGNDKSIRQGSHIRL